MGGEDHPFLVRLYFVPVQYASVGGEYFKWSI